MLVLQRLWGDASALLNLQGLRVRYGSCISSWVPQVGPMHRYPRVRFPVSSLYEKVKISVCGMYGNRPKNILLTDDGRSAQISGGSPRHQADPLPLRPSRAYRLAGMGRDPDQLRCSAPLSPVPEIRQRPFVCGSPDGLEAHGER